MEANTHALAVALVKRRAEKALTQDEAAELAGISLGGWRRLETRPETGGVPRLRTQVGVERALEWPRGTVEGLIEGRVSVDEAVTAPIANGPTEGVTFSKTRGGDLKITVIEEIAALEFESDVQVVSDLVHAYLRSRPERGADL